MKKVMIIAAAVALTAAIGTAKPKVKPSVTYAASWDAAVAEAKLLNLPIVVHGHGFF